MRQGSGQGAARSYDASLPQLLGLQDQAAGSLSLQAVAVPGHFSTLSESAVQQVASIYWLQSPCGEFFEALNGTRSINVARVPLLVQLAQLRHVVLANNIYTTLLHGVALIHISMLSNSLNNSVLSAS